MKVDPKVAKTLMWLQRRKATLLAFLAFVVSVEIFLRVVGFGNSLLYMESQSGYQVQPNQTIDRFFNRISYDQYGLRTTGSNLAEGEVILCLGDSITFGGTQINDDQTYPSQLEHLLNSEEKVFDVKNASAAGWSVQNEFIWLSKNNSAHPKYIILQVGQNDLSQTFVDGSIVDNHKSFPSKRPFLAVYEVFDRYLISKLLKVKNQDPGGGKEKFSIEKFDSNYSTFVSFIEYSKKNNIKLYILYIDNKTQNVNNDFKTSRDKLFNLFYGNNIEVIRPLNYDLKNRDLLYRDEVHPNADGNISISKSIFDSISRSEASNVRAF